MILDSSKDIILDADVVFHFTLAGRINEIDTIFPNRLLITDTVCRELSNLNMYSGIGPLIRTRRIPIQRASKDYNLLSEYSYLKRHFGPGESMSMAYCKTYNTSLASSNLTDIHQYCQANNIQYVTTMDFIRHAFVKGIWTLADADFFIYNVKSRGSKLIDNINTIEDYIPRITGII